MRSGDSHHHLQPASCLPASDSPCTRGLQVTTSRHCHNPHSSQLTPISDTIPRSLPTVTQSNLNNWHTPGHLLSFLWFNILKSSQNLLRTLFWWLVKLPQKGSSQWVAEVWGCNAVSCCNVRLRYRGGCPVTRRDTCDDNGPGVLQRVAIMRSSDTQSSGHLTHLTPASS